ncbi:hypothetical protein [Glaciecola sp. 1036]|uniref:hypothetical protein n=1 Tax=Alteromonadaceae TaxID=72275 RepID=UPI003CFCFFBC
MWQKVKVSLLIVLVLVLILVFLSVDFSGSVSADGGRQLNDADSVNQLLYESRQAIIKRKNNHQIKITQSQATSLAGFLQRAYPEARAIVDFRSDHIMIAATYQFTELFGGLYFNLYAEVVEGEGFNLRSVSVGQVHVPGGLALWLTEIIANRYTQSDVASVALDTIEAVQVIDKTAIVSLKPLLSLLSEFKKVDTSGEDERSNIFKQRVMGYLFFLDQLPPNPENRNSLNYYLVELMKEAKVYSQNGDPVLENEAAIMALSAYAGHRRFARTVGNLSETMGGVIPTVDKGTTLAGRHDLSLHFIFSAAIKLLSQQGFSIAVGEFKELMDRGQGGSGYSFVDLSADMAGAHFASLAVTPELAESIQDIIIAFDDENAYFPQINNLDEGLSKQAFIQKYGSVDSETYQKVVKVIQGRIDALPISH